MDWMHLACGTDVNFGMAQRMNDTGLNSVCTYLIGSPKIHVHPGTQNVTFFDNCDYLRWGHTGSEWALNPTHWWHWRGRKLWKHRHTEKEAKWNQRQRLEGPIGHRMPEIAGKHQKLEEKNWRDWPLEPPEGTITIDTLISAFGLLATR